MWEKLSVPPCGMYIGSGVYHTSKDTFWAEGGLDKGTFTVWNPEDTHLIEYLDHVLNENQGNMIQMWQHGTDIPWQAYETYDLESVGEPYPGPDTDIHDYDKYKKRMGAGLIRLIREAKERGIYVMGIYNQDIEPEYARQLNDFGDWWLGYNFGERYTFRLPLKTGDAVPEKMLQHATLEDYADGLIQRIREHVEDRKAKGWGRIQATSGAFHLDYEVFGGAEIPLQEDFAFRHLTISSAFGRGLFRQFRLPAWGSHVAHEHYSWIPYASKYKFPLLAASFMYKYMSGAKIIVNESGNWHSQVKLCPDSPQQYLPFGVIGTALSPDAPKTPEDLSRVRAEAEKMFPTIGFDSPAAKSYRKVISEFYDYVKEHGTPEGQPEASFAIAKGNLDLGSFGGNCDGNYAIAGAYDLADINHDWYEGTPEFSWRLIENVFCPRPPELLQPYQNLFLSATPHGVFDIVSFIKDQITAEFLNANYKALIFAGWNTCSVKQYEVLREYVENGGILCLTLAHLSTNKKRNSISFGVEELVNGGDLSALCGVRVKAKGRRIYWVTGTSREPNELGLYAPRRWGTLGVPIGDLEFTDRNIDILAAEDEGFEPVILRHRLGKGEVYLVNTWCYPAALHIDYGPGAKIGDNGFLELLYRYLAKKARGHVYITDDGMDPGENCKYINCTYFPDAGTICLQNIDFDHPHEIYLHQFGNVGKIELAPAEFRQLNAPRLTPDEKQNMD